MGDLGGCWTHLGASLSALGPSSKGLGSLFGASEEHFGDILELFGDDFGAWTAVSKRLMKILKNLKKRCKVLQKSRFGGSEINEKITLEGKMRAKSMPSWLIRAQDGAKRVNLEAKRHQVGAQRGFGSAQGGAKRAQKGYGGH